MSEKPASHYSQRADRACDFGRRFPVRPTLVIRKNGSRARPRAADLGSEAKRA